MTINIIIFTSKSTSTCITPFTILQQLFKNWLFIGFYLSIELDRPGVEVAHEPLLVSECMAEVAAVAVGTDITCKDHAADLSLVSWVADNRAELFNAVCKLAVVTIWACACLLPFVAQFCLEHALVVHF